MKKYLLTLISILVLTVFAIEANAQCTVVIGQPAQLTAAISGNGGAYCLNADVTFTVTVAGGTPPYTVTYESTVLTAAPFEFTFPLTENTVIDEADIIVVDAHECNVSITGSVEFTIENTPPAVECATTRNLEGCGVEAITGPVFSATLAPSSYDEFTNAVNAGSVSDDCGIQKVEYQDALGTATCPLTVTRTWTITDNSGNVETCEQTITVDDTEAPAITELANDDLVIDCDEEDIDDQIATWLANHAGATATDVCGTVNWTNNYTALTPGCGSTGTATVIFKAEDACLNASTFTATITVQDIVAPTITVQAEDETVECDGAGNTAALTAWLANHGGATATDNCGNVTWSYSPSLPAINEGCGATGFIEVTFRATDACGLFSETTATFTIEDKTKPVINITGKEDLTIECADATMDDQITAWLADHAGATASDACSGNTITWTNNYEGLSLSNGCGNTGEMTVTFTATDDCHNFETTTAKIIVNDNTPPAITCPANILVQAEAGTTTTAVTVPLPVIAETCGGYTYSNDYTNAQNASGNYPLGVTTVTYTVADDCENVNECTFTVTVEQLPAFTTEFEDVQCFEGSDGWIKITPNSGTAPFRYSIDNGANYTAPSSDLYYQFNGLPAGTYKIRIKDANDYETPYCD